MTKTRRGSSPGSRELTVRVKTARGRRSSSTRWLQRQLNDPYVAEAKKAGYRSRAAWKLAQLDDRFRFLLPGHHVVDLGAAPGGWTQVAVERVRARGGAEGGEGGAAGRVIAADIVEIERIEGAEHLTLDMTDPDAADQLRGLAGRSVDVVLSDMAAPTIGHRSTDHLRTIVLCEAAVEFAFDVLRPGGVFVAKVFQGGADGDLLKNLKRRFTQVKHVKPAASRDTSPETYLVATGFKADSG